METTDYTSDDRSRPPQCRELRSVHCWTGRDRNPNLPGQAHESKVCASSLTFKCVSFSAHTSVLAHADLLEFLVLSWLFYYAPTSAGAFEKEDGPLGQWMATSSVEVMLRADPRIEVCVRKLASQQGWATSHCTGLTAAVSTRMRLRQATPPNIKRGKSELTVGMSHGVKYHL